MKNYWTQDELEILRIMYPHCVTQDVAEAIGRSVNSCHTKAKYIGLSKTDAFYQKHPQGHREAKFNAAQEANLFKPGLVPWNKGMKGLKIGNDKTQFKPGAMPQNWLPVGSYRVSGHILEIKWRDHAGSNHQRWKPVSRLVWEAYHGLVPKGSIVIFKPGTQTIKVEDIRIENLECITRAEHARRNHPNSKSPEFARLCQLKGAIARQFNRIAREAESSPQ